jgi:hypothetical protein
MRAGGAFGSGPDEETSAGDEEGRRGDDVGRGPGGEGFAGDAVGRGFDAEIRVGVAVGRRFDPVPFAGDRVWSAGGEEGTPFDAFPRRFDAFSCPSDAERSASLPAIDAPDREIGASDRVETASEAAFSPSHVVESGSEPFGNGSLRAGRRSDPLELEDHLVEGGDLAVGYAALTTGRRRLGFAGAPVCASIISSMIPWQLPQSSPAQQAPVTASTLSAPASMAALTVSSVTARQTQTYISS